MPRRPILMVLLLASLALAAAGCFHHGGYHSKGRSHLTQPCPGPCGNPCSAPCGKARPCTGPCGPVMQPGAPCAGGPGAGMRPCGASAVTTPCGGGASQAGPAEKLYMCASTPSCGAVSDKPGNCSCGKLMQEMNIPPQMMDMMRQRMKQDPSGDPPSEQAPQAEPHHPAQ